MAPPEPPPELPDPPGSGESPPERPEPSASSESPRAPVVQPARYGRYVVLLALLILVAITINTVSTKPNGTTGLASGERLPPFAVPLATGNLKGDANVSRAGKAPACTVRGPEVLNICQLYEKGPVVLVLFVDGGSCPDLLGDLQALKPSFPGVQVAAVSIKGDRGSLRRLVRKRHLTFPVGLDDKGDLAALYKLATCPQTTFSLQGGVAQGKALLNRPPPATLRARLSRLLAASNPKRGTG
jgi:AhpC/TSA family